MSIEEKILRLERITHQLSRLNLERYLLKAELERRLSEGRHGNLLVYSVGPRTYKIKTATRKGYTAFRVLP